jgi:hypothetical protein
MANKFAVIGCSGIIVAVVCFTAAGLIAGNSLRGMDRSAWKEGLRDGLDDMFGRNRCPRPGGASGTRNIAWDGDDEVDVSLSANIHYRQGSGDQVTVSGDDRLLDHVRIRNGNIRLDCHQRGDDGRLDITLPGRNFRAFSFKGSGDVDLAGIDQPALELNVVGAGDVKVAGRSERLEVNLLGSGNADLRALVVADAELNVLGSGDIDVSATERLELSMMGSGDVTLHREPRHMSQSIFGSGEIHRDMDETPPADAPKPAEPPAAPEAPKKGI